MILGLALLRYALILLALVWSGLRARGRPGLSLAAGLAFALLAQGYWAGELGRPYGLFVDPGITRCAGDAAVAAAGAPPGQGMLVDEPPRCAAWAETARLLPDRVRRLLPTLTPVVALPLLGALVYLLSRGREEAFVASFLWLVFSTGELETLRGVGFVPGLWAHPAAGLFFCLLVAGVLALSRLERRHWLIVAASAGLLLTWLFVPGPAERRSLPETLLILSFDQTPWWALAAWGWRRGTPPAAASLIVGGALLLLAGAVVPGVDVWGAQAVYRLGLLLAATGPVVLLAERLGAAVARRWARVGARPADVGTAALVLMAAPASFLVWWNPLRADPVMEASLPAVATRLTEAMRWVRENTPPTAVFLASPDYAPSIAVLAGRRVLRAPTLGAAADETRRERMEDKVLSGRDPIRLADLYGLTHVFIAPGDFYDRGILSPADLERSGRFRRVYADAEDYRVYEITRPE